jgi:hypothetical protein
VVFQGFPENLQHIAFGAFNTFVDLVALETLGLGDHVTQAAGNGFVKCGVLAGVDANVCQFENHGGLRGGC